MTLSKDKVSSSLSVLHSASSDVRAELVSKKCRSVSYEMRIVLKLIKEGLAHNIVFEGIIEKNLTGTPQGGIASPILFNIYMHEFDLFVNDTVKKHWKTMSEKEEPVAENIQEFTGDILIELTTQRRVLKN